MKKMTSIFLSLVLVIGLTACGNSQQVNDTATSAEAEETDAADNTAGSAEIEEGADAEDFVDAENAKNDDLESTNGKILVAYYSATGSTAAVAETIADAMGGDLFELVPVEPYSSDDLDWTNSNSRVSVEYANEEQRVVELVADSVDNWDEYDTVFIGYPIWWGIAAWPVNEFVENNDFSGKTVIPFCTSSSSGLGESGELLEEMASSGEWQEGKRFRSSVSSDDVRAWVEELNLEK